MTLAVNLAQGASNNVTFRNRIINGACVIDQRNAGASVTPSVNGTYLVDRWNLTFSQGSKFSAQQNAGAVTPPAGYINYLGLTVVASVSVGTGDYFAVQQPIEGLNVADLAWGTANAQAVTLSFWVRSSLTGTFGGALSNSAGSRSYPFTYTISAANTWELETITIPGDTSGTWLTTNGIGVYVRFGLGSGATYSGTAGSWAASNYFTATSAVSVVGTGSATFYFTGVQLEAGTTASPFEYRQYGTELALCQRYYFAAYKASTDSQEVVVRTGLTGFDLTTYVPVTMRTTPTIYLASGSTYGNLVGYDSSFNPVRVSVTAMSNTAADQQSLSALHLSGTNSSLSFASGQGSCSFDTIGNSAGIGLSAEL